MINHGFLKKLEAAIMFYFFYSLSLPGVTDPGSIQYIS